MLQITGTVLEVREEIKTHDGSTYTQRDVRLLVGKSSIETVRLPRDFIAHIPGEGEEVTLAVFVRAWAGRSGAGYTLMALKDQSGVARKVSAVA